MRKFGLIVAACGLLTGSCASLSEEQCLAGNWEGIGFNDGANGAGTGRFGDHMKACEKHGVVPDQATWMTGRARGLTIYCQPGRGFQVGRQGYSYGGVCPASLEGGFLSGYNDGRVVWDAQQRLNRANNEINEAQQRSDDLDSRMRADETRLADSTVSDDEKKAIRERLKRLRDDRRRADEDARDARYRRDEAEREINQLRYRFAQTYGSW